MKDIKTFYKGTLVVISAVFCSYFLGLAVVNLAFHKKNNQADIINTDFGSFLAAQHALYVNDFDSAVKFVDDIKTKNDSVDYAKNISGFFNGTIPENAGKLKDSKDVIDVLIYDAFLIKNNDWAGIYNRHDKDKSVFAAPLRIFSAAKQGKIKETNKFIDSLQINESWKAFIRGQIAVLNNDIDTAAKEFAKVHPEFMNINDYLYLMSFYRQNGMEKDMEILRDDFLTTPTGMFVINYPDIPDWSNFDGYTNNLAFSIIQTISHTQITLYTDLSLMFLRFAQIISDGTNMDAINYYLGQYYFYNAGDYESFFNKIRQESPLYLLSRLNLYEKNKNFDAINKIARKNPLFIPAVQIVVKENIKQGNKNRAISALNRALRQKNLSNDGKKFFLKQRAYVHSVFGDFAKAQEDLQEIKDIDLKTTSDLMFLQAKIWALQNRNMDDAYEYAMNLIKKNPSDVYAWDLVARIVAKTEDVDSALEILESIGASGVNLSLIYDNLGDLYTEKGEKEKALRAYQQALDLSDDCLIVVPFIQKKIRKIK